VRPYTTAGRHSALALHHAAHSCCDMITDRCFRGDANMRARCRAAQGMFKSHFLQPLAGGPLHKHGGSEACEQKVSTEPRVSTEL
jgi:hypothetical protein